jgi:hypothetical protein
MKEMKKEGKKKRIIRKRKEKNNDHCLVKMYCLHLQGRSVNNHQNGSRKQSDPFLRNVGIPLLDYTASHPRRY